MNANGFPWREKRAAMIIAHPGHELRVHHWLETAKPATLVLTDGSGRTMKSRLDSTTKILQAAGATAGPVYGRFTDAEIYQAMLAGKQEIFLALLEEMADWLVSGRIDYLAGDALEGYNTSHEVCRFLTGAACELATRRSGRTIQNFDFLLTGRPDECPRPLQAGAICLRLDVPAVARKLAAARNYPELQHEVDFALKEFAADVFAVEWLRPAANSAGLHPAAAKPYYETHSEKQMAAGHYQNVIREQEHLLPLARAGRILTLPPFS
jgi:AcrR family transcriptional regulator